MGGKVVTITSGKGGVGKTTATANLGISLAELGNSVVVIDADIGLRNLDVIMGLENRIVYDLVDIVEGRAKLRQGMIKHKKFEQLFLIPAAQTRDKMAVSPEDMVKLSDELREDHDYILIDSPAGIERGFRNALEPADEVLIVTNPEVSAVRDADRIIGLIEAAEKGPGRLIINRIKPGNGQKRRNAFGRRCLRHPFPGNHRHHTRRRIRSFRVERRRAGDPQRKLARRDGIHQCRAAHRRGRRPLYEPGRQRGILATVCTISRRRLKPGGNDVCIGNYQKRNTPWRAYWIEYLDATSAELAPLPRIDCASSCSMTASTCRRNAWNN